MIASTLHLPGFSDPGVPATEMLPAPANISHPFDMKLEAPASPRLSPSSSMIGNIAAPLVPMPLVPMSHVSATPPPLFRKPGKVAYEQLNQIMSIQKSMYARSRPTAVKSTALMPKPRHMAARFAQMQRTIGSFGSHNIVVMDLEGDTCSYTQPVRQSRRRVSDGPRKRKTPEERKEEAKRKSEEPPKKKRKRKPRVVVQAPLTWATP